MTINEIVRPTSIGEAQRILQTKHNSAVLGGGAFMRLGSKHIDTAIDLQDAGLRYIIDNPAEDCIEIGAMTTFRDLETNELLMNHFGGLIPQSVANIVGVQLRNILTVGGTIIGRYGFSELITGLLVLDCFVVMHDAAPIALVDFLKAKVPQHLLFEKLIIKKEPLQTGYQMMRMTSGALPMLSVAVALPEAGVRIAVGARPGLAQRAELTERAFTDVLPDALLHKLNNLHCSEQDNVGLQAAKELTFGDDTKCSAAYRKEICATLVNRAIQMAGEVQE